MEKLASVSLKNRPYFIDCIQWNEDGQLAICLDAHVHIIVIKNKRKTILFIDRVLFFRHLFLPVFLPRKKVLNMLDSVYQN